jgi:hypothetical protein
MVRKSPLYQASCGGRKKESQFFNEVMSKANVFKLGERVTVESEGPVPSKQKPRGPVYAVKGT